MRIIGNIPTRVRATVKTLRWRSAGACCSPVLRWDETAYTYLKRQSTDHAGRWVDIEGPAAPAIASREAGRATATSATARRSLFDIFKSR